MFFLLVRSDNFPKYGIQTVLEKANAEKTAPIQIPEAPRVSAKTARRGTTIPIPMSEMKKASEMMKRIFVLSLDVISAYADNGYQLEGLQERSWYHRVGINRTGKKQTHFLLPTSALMMVNNKDGILQ